MVVWLVPHLKRAATILPLVAVPPTPMGVKAHWRLVFFGRSLSPFSDSDDEARQCYRFGIPRCGCCGGSFFTRV